MRKGKENPPPDFIKKEVTLDELFKIFLNDLPPPLITAMINRIFGHNYDENAKIVMLDKESVGNFEKRMSDAYFAVICENTLSVLQIEDDFYHFESQTTNDNTMSLRVFEYAFLGARTHSSNTEISGDELVTRYKLPRSAVFFLKSDEKTPRRLRNIVEVTDFDGAVKELNFVSPCIRMGDYTPGSLAEEHLYIMLPFFPLKFSRIMTQKHDAEAETALKNEIAEFSEIVTQLISREKLDETTGTEILNTAHRLGRNFIDKSQNLLDKKGVEQVMESVRETIEFVDYIGTFKKWKADGIAEGEARGEARGEAKNRIRTIVSLLSQGIDPKVIAQIDGYGAELVSNVAEKFKAQIESKAKENDEPKHTAKKNKPKL
jgi:hypothetical protein